MPKYKVGDKVRVVRYKGNYFAKQAMVGQICEIKDIDLTCSSGAYAIWQPDKKDYWYFDEDEFAPTSKRGRPRKDACRKDGSAKPSEFDKLKEALKETNKELRYLSRQFIEFKRTTEINICNLGYEVNAVKPKEKKVELTDAERVILENLDKKFKWIARDANYELSLYQARPVKIDNGWYDYLYFTHGFDLFNHLFQFIQWSDSEPYEIAKLLEG